LRNRAPLDERQKELHREAVKRWRAKNPETAKQRSRDKEYRRKYGITLAEYDELLKAQLGVCAICEMSCDTGNNLAVDHCHVTNKVRGLLCKNCNTAIGLLRDDAERIMKAAEYVTFHQITDGVA